MRTSLICFVLALLGTCYMPAICQTSETIIKGTVKDSSGKALSAASVTVKGQSSGTVADNNGNFIIKIKSGLPITLIVSAIGSASQEILVGTANQMVNAVLADGSNFGNVTITGVSRKLENRLVTPAAVELQDHLAIVTAAAQDYYASLNNLKGVDMTKSSITFNSISTRGFNGSGNLRLNQFTEGMDNQAPGLSFSVGSIIGLTELDVDNVEILPGASSALYGSGGTNGTVLITGRNPFKYQGLSVQYKQGANHLSDPRRGAAPLFDGEIRYAKSLFKNRFAFKIAAKYLNAKDWQADDSTDLLRNNVFSTVKPGNRISDANYDGVNVFGDEASASMQAFAQAVRGQLGATLGSTGIANINTLITSGINSSLSPATIAGMLPSSIRDLAPFLIPTNPTPNNPYATIYGNQLVSRQGYAEKDLVDYNAYNYKITGGLYYKITNNTEISAQAYYGRGTTVYTGSDRYALKNLQVGQYKLEIKNPNWFLRAYTTQENSGDSYTATTAAVAINSSWKTNATWFQQYTGTYGAAKLGLNNAGLPLTDDLSHQAARAVAETGRLMPGTQGFKDAFDKAVGTPISSGGAKFTDKTSLYHTEGQYNLSNIVKIADVLVGASYRVYHLNSGGTIFSDTDGPIDVSEYGAYVQVQKKFLDDVLKLTASGRYDKNENFKGRFTPRFSALIKVAKDNHFRISYQVAYRFPSTQDQYLNLQTPSAKLIGGLAEFKTFYKFDTSPAYTAESITAYRASIASGINPGLLKVAAFNGIKPETMNSYEIGYRGLLNKNLLIDAYGYMSRYKNFIGRVAVGRGTSANPLNTNTELLSPFTTTNYSFAVNSSETIKANGWGLGLDYRFIKNFSALFNVSGDQLQNVPNGFITFFNAPKIRYNLGLSVLPNGKTIGFNAVFRWQDGTNWESTFGTGNVPSYGTMDANISYLFTKAKTLIKIGGSNIFNNYYRSAFGNPYIGALFYASFGYNVF